MKNLTAVLLLAALCAPLFAQRNDDFSGAAQAGPWIIRTDEPGGGACRPLEIYYNGLMGTFRMCNAGVWRDYPSVPPTGNRVVFLGDSIEIRGGTDTQWEQNSWVSHFLIREKGQVYMLHNAGVSGNTCAQVLARFDTDVAAYSPDRVFLKCGTNDVGNSVPTATSIALIQTLVANTNAIGATLILCTIPPRSDGFHTAIEALNAGICTIARTNRLPLVDFYRAVVDPANGNYLTAYNGDNVHPSAIGARVMADAAIAATAGMWRVWHPYLAIEDPNSFFTNGLMLTDNDADGVADSWTKFGASTATMKLVTDPAVVGKWQQAAYGNVTMDQSFTAGGAKWAVGDRLAFSGRVQTYGMDGSGGAYKIFADLEGCGSSCAILYPVGSLWTVDTDGAFYIEFVVPAGTTGVTCYFILQTNATAMMRIGQVALLNLTRLGLNRVRALAAP